MAGVSELSGSVIEERLSELFGQYKAEWLGDKLYDLFREPRYFSSLKAARPCVLVGGRGTGKTTVLRSLAYEGQFALAERKPADILGWPSYGMYYRVDTNRVAAFRGPEITRDRWTRVFGHYINLLLCQATSRFLVWHAEHTGIPCALDTERLLLVCRSLNMRRVSTTIYDLSSALELSLVEFEAAINNIADSPRLQLSIQGAPVSLLLDAASRLPQFAQKTFFFLIDEYENLIEDYQQRVFNTLIKHSGPLYSFKIGVRELGWRTRATLNEHEVLIDPADYVRIDIKERLSGPHFDGFGRAVCGERVSRLLRSESGRAELREESLDLLFPSLTEREEAELLGVEERAGDIRNRLAGRLPAGLRKTLDSADAMILCLIGFWAEGHRSPLERVFRDYVERPGTWQARLGNHRHAVLFTLRRGVRGIRKYYCGWQTFASLAAGNVRYLLQLVDESLLLHVRNGQSLPRPVSPDMQTRAAQTVSQKNLTELQGIDVSGAKLTKLLLSLGRVFGVMAAQAEGHAPEVNQFYLKDLSVGINGPEEKEADELLRAAVMNLALLRFTGSKLTQDTDIREYDYMVHPIYAPFFVYSYRRKRKFLLSVRQLIGLVKDPHVTMRGVLASVRRSLDESLPEQVQLSMFGGYYDAEQSSASD